ncbi:MAG: hypothetical protein AB1938_10610 [Myxococcota bacterium]
MNWNPRLLLASLACLCVLAGCGPTIGDACATDKDCGAGVCLIKDYAPSGACSLACVVGGAPCPAGTLCVKDAIMANQPGCMKACKRQADCRDEYVCNLVKDSETPVCVGPAGI